MPPIIQFKVYSTEVHGSAVVGSFDLIAETVRGKSETYKILAVEAITEGILIDAAVSRVRDFSVFEEFSALMFMVDYVDETDAVFQQYQIMQWSDDREMKCVIASDTSERVAAYYEESIIEALVELMTYCAVGLNEDVDQGKKSG